MADKIVSFTIAVKDAATAGLKQIEKAGDDLVTKLFSLKSILGGMVDAFAAISVAHLVKDLIDFGTAADTAFRSIAANLPTFHEGMTQLKEDIESIASTSGRSLETMEAAAVSIAKLGVSSAEDLKQQLQASTLLADATSTSVDDSARLLIQLRREFSLTGDQALEMAAKLAQASRGHVDPTELFTAFATASPIFRTLGIDVDTATNAIIALVTRGDALRQIRTELKQLDAQGFRDLAAQVPVAGNAIAELTLRVNENTNATVRANQTLKNEFISSLEQLGLNILPMVNTALQGTIGLMNAIRAGNWDAIVAGVLGKQSTLDSLLQVDQPKQSDVQFHTAPTLAAQGLAPPKKSDPVADSVARKQAEKDAIALAKALATLRQESTALEQQTETARPKSEAFAAAIQNWADKATAAGMSAANLNAELAKLNAIHAGMQIAESAKDTTTAFDALDAELGKLSGDTLQKLQAEQQKVLDSLDAMKSKIDNPGDLEAFDAKVAKLKDTFANLRTAIGELTGTQTIIQGMQDAFAEHAMTTQQISDEMSTLVAQSEVARQNMIAATDPAVAAEYRKELQAISTELQQLQVEWDEVGGTVVDNTKNVREMVRAWDEVARSVIGAAQAVLGLSSNAAAALQNVVTLSGGIGEAATGNVGQGAASIISSISGIATALIKTASDDAAAQQQFEDARVKWADSFKRLVDSLNANPLDQAKQALADKFSALIQQAILDAEKGTGTTLTDPAFSNTDPSNILAIINALKAFEAQDLPSNRNEFQTTIDYLNQLNAAYQQQAVILAAQQKIVDEQNQEDYKVRQLRAEGLTQEADALALAEKQQREYTAAVKAGATLDALQALTAAQAAETAQAQTTAQSASIVSAIAAQTTILQASLSTQQASLTTATTELQTLQQAADSLKTFKTSLATSALSPLSPAAQLDVARQQMMDLFAKAQGGDATAAGQFGTAANSFLTADRGYNASNSTYASDFTSVQQMTDQLTGKFTDAASLQQQMVTALQSEVTLLTNQLDTLKTANTLAGETTAAIIAAAQAQRDAVLAPNAALIDAFAQLSATLTGVGKDVVDAEGRTLAGDAAAVIASTQAEIDAVNSGATLAQITALDQIRALEAQKTATDDGFAQQIQTLGEQLGFGSPVVQQLRAQQAAYDTGAQAQITILTNQLDQLTNANTIAGETQTAIIQAAQTQLAATLTPNTALVASFQQLSATLTGVGKDVVDAEARTLAGDTAAVTAATQNEIAAINAGASVAQVTALDQIRVLEAQKTATDDGFAQQIQTLGQQLGFDSPVVQQLVAQQAAYDAGVQNQINAVNTSGQQTGNAIIAQLQKQATTTAGPTSTNADLLNQLAAIATTLQGTDADIVTWAKNTIIVNSNAIEQLTAQEVQAINSNASQQVIALYENARQLALTKNSIDNGFVTQLIQQGQLFGWSSPQVVTLQQLQLSYDRDVAAAQNAARDELNAINSGASAAQIQQLDQIKVLEDQRVATDNFYAQQLMETAKIYGWDSPQVAAIVALMASYDAGVTAQINALQVVGSSITGAISRIGPIGAPPGPPPDVTVPPFVPPHFQLPGGVSTQDLGSVGGPNDIMGLVVPMMAGGGSFAGGLRMVGEMGPELEFTGPARIASSSDTQRMLNNALGAGTDTLAEMRALRDEIRAMTGVTAAGAKATMTRLDTLITKTDENTTATRRGLERLGVTR